MVELALLIEMSMRPVKQRTFTRILKYLKIGVALFCIALISGWTIACMEESKRSSSNDGFNQKSALLYTANTWAGRCFLVLTCFLFLSIGIVIWRLKVK